MKQAKKTNQVMEMPLLGGIGSEFYLPISLIFEKNNNQFKKYVFGHTNIFLSSGRDALFYIIQVLNISKNHEVLLPSYLCEEVLKPFKNKTNVVFYELNKNLSINVDDIRSKISKHTKIVLVIHYFGFPQDISSLKQIQKDHSFIIIEDVVQAFLSEYDGVPFGQNADISISSYRKWLPVPDGSLLTFNENVIKNNCPLTYNPLHTFYIFIRTMGLLIKYFSVKFNKRFFRNMSFYFFRKSEDLLELYKKPAKISIITACLLDKFDYATIVAHRRKNFKILLDSLQNVKNMEPLLKDLPAGVCPLGFPIIVDNRNRLKSQLISSSIYPPIHWKLPNDISKKDFPLSWEISEHILTIPIDQRYTENDMMYILDVIKKLEVVHVIK